MKKVLLLTSIFANIVSSNVFNDIENLIQDKNYVLPAKKAFHFEYTRNESSTILNWKIKSGYYLYYDSIKVVKSNELLQYEVLEGNILNHKDEFFGETKIIKEKIKIFVNNKDLSKYETVFYQGCSEKGFCYPIQSIKIQ
tara:strand:+ start:252 stop:671 length:420 start_codon:yes stop_codon:yes gene_type:complete